MNNAPPPPPSDPIYKRLYAFARMVEDLLRSLFGAGLDADYGTLEKLPAEYVGEALQQRRGDTAWRLRTRGADGWLHVLVMLEFQSTTDAAMAQRVLEYTALLYGELLRRGKAKPGALPPVLPVVLYNGDARWKPATEMRDLIAAPSPLLAPYQPSQRHFVLDQRRAQAEDFKLHELTWTVAQLEQSSSADDLARIGRRLTKLLAGAGEVELRRTFAHWLWALGRSLVGSGPAPMPPEDVNLEDMAMSLVERVAEWRKPYIEQGIQQGIERGMERGISLGREQGISLGREEGISLGREEGIEHERQLLRRLAATRFDSATADRLVAAIGAESDPQRLEEVGEAIVRCVTGGELLREIGSRR